jgi:hypothetical protein
MARVQKRRGPAERIYAREFHPRILLSHVGPLHSAAYVEKSVLLLCFQWIPKTAVLPLGSRCGALAETAASATVKRTMKPKGGR